ncbi:MAG: thiamine phosphate synthase [Wenzhouxiangella sp.]
MTRRAIPTGLYALTPSDWPRDKLLPAVEAAIAGGARMVQYRAKPRPDADTARALVNLCRAAGAIVIVNDDVELAAELGADGVHLGRDDVPVDQARALLGRNGLVGVSCYNDLGRAERLAAAGADYLAFGSLFPSPTKPDAVHCPAETLTRARRFGLPVVAIGGITADNAGEAIAAGADLVAVISDLFESEDIRARARKFQELFAT